MRPLSIFLAIFLFIFLSVGAPISANNDPDTPLTEFSQPQLKLHRGTFDARTEQPTEATAWQTAVLPNHAIIQLNGPITPADRQALKATGVQLLEYLPDYAYLVRGSLTQIDHAAQLPQVYARIPFTLADKLSPSLLERLDTGKTIREWVHVIGWPNDNRQLQQSLQQAGLRQNMIVNAKTLQQLARLESVRWIEQTPQPRLLNDSARQILGVNTTHQERQLYGTNQIIAVADTGLDTGDHGTLSLDFAGRIIATYALTTTGHWDDNHGHGTHVAGSIASAGIESGANPSQHNYLTSHAGMAPEAELVIQAFEADAGGQVIGLDPDHYYLYEQAYNDGARIHSDSWGDVTGLTNLYGGYPFGAQRTDQFIWDYPDMAVFFAAGNNGLDCELFQLGLCIGNGVVDADSLLSPGTAKNVITVGASESLRESGGFGTYLWVLFNFFANPIATDTIANNANGMAAFSARGPADDGRIKPDIVAPGTNIVSNASHGIGAGTLWAVHESNSNYAYSGGTSMATPITAGTGALVREWLTRRGYTNPSAALLKSVMLNTTYDIAPGQHGTGSTQEIPYARPNTVAGWGRVDTTFMDAPLPYGLWNDDHTTGLNTGETVTYTHHISQPLTVLTNTHPLRIMLVWTDPPASLSAASQLVNDLDLVVTGPITTHYGNDVIGGDRINNVEGIIIPTPATGAYTITVQAHNVPSMTQPYALVVSGPIIPHQPATPTITITAGINNAIDLNWHVDSANCGYVLHHNTTPYFEAGTTTVMASPGHVVAMGNSHSIPNMMGNINTQHYFIVRALNCGREGRNSNRVGEFDFSLKSAS